jgi:hypothetical protein
MDRIGKIHLLYPDIEPCELGQKIKLKKQNTITATPKRINKIKPSKIDTYLDEFINM